MHRDSNTASGNPGEPAPVYQIDRACQIVPGPGQPEPVSWMQHLRSEEISDHLRLNVLSFETGPDETIVIEGPPTFSISLFMSGRLQVSVNDGPLLDVAPGTVVFFYAPRYSRGADHVAGGQHLLCLDFRFSMQMVENLGITDFTELARLFTRNCSVDDTMLLARPVTPPIANIARDVLHSPLTGLARRIFLHAKALELLSHLVAEVDLPGTDGVRLAARDRERIRRAADLLRRRYHEPWTIPLLARTVGLNERKLKAGFRTVIGETVHTTLENARLSAAADLLAQGSLPVIEVALAVGYANPSHFARQFRKRHGHPPKIWQSRAEHSRKLLSGT